MVVHTSLFVGSNGCWSSRCPVWVCIIFKLGRGYDFVNQTTLVIVDGSVNRLVQGYSFGTWATNAQGQSSTSSGLVVDRDDKFADCVFPLSCPPVCSVVQCVVLQRLHLPRILRCPLFPIDWCNLGSCLAASLSMTGFFPQCFQFLAGFPFQDSHEPSVQACHKVCNCWI
jgi:hypothetical protein